MSPIHITTFNMGGPGKAAPRRDVSRKTLKTLSPSLILCQELPGYFETNVFDSEQYEFVKTGNEAGVAWRKNDFEKCNDSPKTTDTKVQKIRDGLSKALGENVSELLSRVAMVKLKAKKEGKEVLAVSWHGPWKGRSDEYKKKVFMGLIDLCQQVSKEYGDVPFIIGGDFNFDTSKLDEFYLLDAGVCTSSTYELSERAQDAKDRGATPYKDTFIFSSDIVLKHVKSFDFSTMPGQSAENDPVKLLDHDPISAVLSFEEVLVFTPEALSSDEDVEDVQNRLEDLYL